jgi:NAD(P)-dependent dehydrogenase (short-subunit alcohol dehydrogenase family)
VSTVLITGASSGMGKETAKKLLDEGHTVYVAARRLEKMRDLEELGATALAMDITDDDQVVAAVKRIESETGGVDVLVNNAGFGMYGAVEDSSLDDARYQFEVNLFGLARLTQLVLPHMREQRSGTIVNVSSMGGKIYTPLGAWYHATKHALEGWSDAMRLELKPFGIRVVVVEPGAIATEWGDIMVDGMLERSGDGPYGDLANRLAKRSRASYEKGQSSPASVVADAISQAVNADRPRTRYAVGRYARPMIFIRKWFGDRVFDRVMMSQV